MSLWPLLAIMRFLTMLIPVTNKYWRLITTFLYFGPLSLNLIFYTFFVSRYSRMLEESFFRNRTAEYLWLLTVLGTMLLFTCSFFSMPFLGPYLSNALVYIWARRNPGIQLSFLGLFVFSAPYLPWVLMIFSAVVKSTSPKGELIGIVVGHIYFFFEDIFPQITNGQRPFSPPWLWFGNAGNAGAGNANAQPPREPQQPIEALG